jgi:cation diffusion facilitator CzcD-associated flavoprotein CzcO
MGHDCEVAIIGAGPYGLSLAAHLRARGIDHRIFGRPMDTWTSHMPKNMTLKSEGFASNLSAPPADSTIKAYFQQKNIPYADQTIPVGLDNFLSYADAFRSRFVPHVEDTLVTSLVQAPGGFLIVLDNGERVVARRVVLAVGVSHFAYTPESLTHLPAGLVSHSYNHRDVAQLRGKEVTIIGAGSSAIDLAHLLEASGASPRIVARVEELTYNSAPDPQRETLLFKLQNPPSTIGRGWRSYFCAEAPLLFYRMPKHLKERAITSHLHPAAGWFMREDVEGRIPMSLGRSLAKAETKNGRVSLTLRTGAGAEETLTCDHVIAATGYRVDMARIPFLAPELRKNITLTAGGSPFVFDNFEMSVDGLYTIGLAAMDMFGPLLRFMVGAEFVAPRLAAHLERKVAKSTAQHAA